MKNFQVPSSVKKIAEEGLKLRKEYGRGGTSVGMNTARILAKGGSIPFSKVKHISKYFARHAGDNLDQKDPPSNGRIAWMLWGGDPAWKWSSKTVNSELNESELPSLSSITVRSLELL